MNERDPYGELANQGIDTTLYGWIGPSHIKKKVSTRYFINLGLIAVIICLILIFVQQLFLLMMVLAIVFLLVVLSLAEPTPINHEITTMGIVNGEKFYPWTAKGKNFWYEEDDESGAEMVVIQTRKFPYQVVMLLTERVDKEVLTDLLDNYLIKKRPKQGRMDQFIKWWQRTFPLG